jgi:hypothetical protein
MSMKFKFSRGYGQYQVVQSIAVCCYSNTNSTDVLLEQQWQVPQEWGHIPDGTGGRQCFPR